MNPQKAAALWHVADVVLAGAVFGWAVVGLIGHFRLRGSYRRWHESRRDLAE